MLAMDNFLIIQYILCSEVIWTCKYRHSCTHCINFCTFHSIANVEKSITSDTVNAIPDFLTTKNCGIQNIWWKLLWRKERTHWSEREQGHKKNSRRRKRIEKTDSGNEQRKKKKLLNELIDKQREKYMAVTTV